MVKGTGQLEIHRNYTHGSVPHDLLIAKHGTYSLDRSSLRLLMAYLNSLNNEQKLVHPCKKLIQQVV